MSIVAWLMVSGCAPFSGPKSVEYVTVESDPRHDTDRARKAYKRCREYMEKHVRGEACDLDHVEKYLREALVADVRFGPAHHSLGIVYFWQKRLYLAAWEFEYAARLMPDRYEPLNNLGLVYETVGKLDQAKTYYLLAREKSPNNPEVIGNLARVSFREGQPIDAMRPLLEDVVSTSDHDEWRRWAGELLGVNPPPIVAPFADRLESPATPPSAEPDSAEELPLIAPPAPNAQPSAPLLDDSDTSPPTGGLLDFD